MKVHLAAFCPPAAASDVLDLYKYTIMYYYKIYKDTKRRIPYLKLALFLIYLEFVEKNCRHTLAAYPKSILILLYAFVI